MKVSPSLLVGGCHSLILILPQASCCSQRSLARFLSGSLGKPRVGALEPGWWWGVLCACVSGPYLFSPLLILVPPAAPHTKPHSPNPQGGGKGGQLYPAAPFRASYPCPSAGSSQQCWPWCPPRQALDTARGQHLGKGSSGVLFLSKIGPVFSAFWFLGGRTTLAGAFGH